MKSMMHILLQSYAYENVATSYKNIFVQPPIFDVRMYNCRVICQIL